MSEISKPHTLWQPPRLRTLEADGPERHATWLELFYDLILVAAITQLGQSLSNDFSGSGILRFVVLFVPIWWSWTGMVFFATRFDTGDLLQRFFYLLQIVGIGALAVSVHDGLNTTSTGFAIAYAGIRLVLVLQYLVTWHFAPQAHALIRRYIIGFTVSGLLWFYSTALPIPERFWLWGLAMLFDFGAPLTAGRLHLQVPPHLSHLTERYGLFTIIVLGESVLATVSGISRQHHLQPLSGLDAICGVVIAFCIWWLYFDRPARSALTETEEKHRIGLYQTWLYSHLPLTMALTALSVSLQQVILSPQAVALGTSQTHVLCGSMALTLFSLGLVQTSSCFIGRRMTVRLWLPYLLSATLLLILGWTPIVTLIPLQWCLMIAVISIGNVLLQLLLERRIYNLPCNVS